MLPVNEMQAAAVGCQGQCNKQLRKWRSHTDGALVLTMQNWSFEQSYLGCDFLPAEGTSAELVPAAVAGLMPTIERQPAWSLHAHCTAHRLFTGLPLILGYAALQYHLPHSFRTGLKGTCCSSSTAV